MTLKRQSHKSRSLLREFFLIVGLFAAVYLANDVYTNWDLFSTRFEELGQATGISSGAVDEFGDPYDDKDVATNLSLQQMVQRDQYITQKVDSYIQAHGWDTAATASADDTMESRLKARKDNYVLGFNTLPPDNRIVVPAMGIDVPLNEGVKTYQELVKGDFDQDLYDGVVRYPTTATPGQTWNVFVFGHTSYDYYKHNPYATVFSNLPKLKPGDSIKVVRDGTLYSYNVKDTVVVSPKKVKDVYEDYNTGKYLMLMWCYPIGSDTNRMIVIAQQSDT